VFTASFSQLPENRFAFIYWRLELEARVLQGRQRARANSECLDCGRSRTLRRSGTAAGGSPNIAAIAE